MPSDDELVRAACDGVPEAFEALVERYQERLLRFLATRSASRADAEDVLQDTFINAYRYIASYDPRWRFSTWLYRIALREAARHAKRALPGPGPGDGRDSGDALRDLAAAPEADPLAAVSSESSRANLWFTARSVLSDEAYAAMWLRYVEDMSLKEVAAALERSTSWTKVTLMRSRDRLMKAAQADNDIRGQAYG